MPTYKTLYKGTWVNIETDISNANNQKQIDVDIYDTDSGLGAVETTIPLEMTGEPTIFETLDNAENKFTVLRPKKAEVKIYSSDSISIETFGGGGDQRFYAEIKYDSVLKFVGWLSISDLRQDFMPHPNEITLVATCGLNLLSNIPLTDFDGVNPTYEHRIIEYLAWIFSKTGHQLNIVCSFNLRSSDAATINNAPLVTAATFSLIPNHVNVSTTNFFYVGQTVTITGTSGNNVTFFVTEVEQLTGVTSVHGSGNPFSNETGVTATFTDQHPENGHFFMQMWLFAKTFEDDINTCVDCAQALEIILKRMNYVTQKDGYWFINCIDELETRDLYLFTFDYLGNFVSNTTDDFVKSVGADELHTWMNDDQAKSLENAVKEVQINFGLDVPREILTNYDLSRGTDLTSTTVDPEGWKLERNYPALAETSTPGYIKKVFVDGQEKERYLYIEVSATNFYHAWRNLDKIYVHPGDKISISIDWRHDANEGGSGHYQLPVAMIRLWGDDGTHWHLNMSSGYGSIDPTTYWIQSNASWTTNARYLYHEGDFGQDDLSEWQTASGTSAPIPVKGRLEVFLVHNFKSNERGKSFAAISFDYIPYIAGTYAKYKAHQYKVSQTLSTVQVIKDDAGIAGTIKYLFKRALLKVSGSNAIYTGAITFTNPNSISLPLASGYSNYLFAIGKKITSSGTNNLYYTIEDIIYHTIGDYTEIIIKEDNLTTILETTTLSEILFDLTDSFYAANVFPDGPPDSTYYHPYGHIQVLDVWNQNNRVMSKVEGNIDHLGTDDDIPDITHKYFLTDPDLSTNNKVFMALHMRQNLHDVETNTLLHEVFDETIPKEYPEPEFKYVT